MRLNPSNTKLRKAWDHLKPEELETLQMERLRWFLRKRVVPFSKHYRRLFESGGVRIEDLKSYRDLAALPFTSKKDLLTTPENPDRSRDFVLIPDPAVLRRQGGVLLRGLMKGRKRLQAELEKEFRPIIMTSTTGRSTDPVPFLYTAHDLDNLARAGRRMMEICDSRTDWRHINLFPFAPHLAFWLAHYAGLGFNTFCLSTGGGKVMGTSGNVGLLNRIQPDALIGMPTFVYHVLQEAVAQDLRCEKIKRIVLGGEKVPEGMRRKLKDLAAQLGSDEVKIMATYGFTEAKMAFPECPAPAGAAPSGYHLYPDLGIVEIIDPESGEPVGAGEGGEIVFTALDSRGSVVLRYRTGDQIDGGLVTDVCPFCGRTVPRLVGKISRVSDYRRLNIDKLKGTLVNFNELEHVLDDLAELGAWQIELRKFNDDPLEADQVIVHASLLNGKGDDDAREALRRKIERKFRAATEISPNRVEFHNAETLRDLQGVGRALKEEKVVDHRPSSKAGATPGPDTTTNRQKNSNPTTESDEEKALEITGRR